MVITIFTFFIYDILTTSKKCHLYSDIYVTDSGLIYSCNRKFVNNGNGIILRPHPDEDGYLRVSIYDLNHIKKLVAVHTLVLLTYLGNKPNDKYVANHKDGNRINNHIDNLEWCSITANERHAWNNGKEDKIRRNSNGIFIAKD